MGAMKCEETIKVNIGQAVAPSKHECRITDVGCEALDAPARLGQ